MRGRKRKKDGDKNDKNWVRKNDLKGEKESEMERGIDKVKGTKRIISINYLYLIQK